MAKKPTVRDQLRTFSLGLPEAYEDFPWGERVTKVNKKVFVFLGVDGGDSPGFSVKLDESHALAMAVPGAEPTGYGLGRAGWVSVPLHGDIPPVEVLLDWVEESYRRVAPKRLIKVLDEG
jgi:predicted DNA-binding protein (MmcQ/YjbR family)